MSDLPPLIVAAWKELWPKLRKDPDELAKRLARRRMKVITRPPRAWCLGVRANDLRIDAMHAIVVPEHALSPEYPGHRGKMVRHEVTLDPRLLRWLCRPVWLAAPGPDWRQVAGLLGKTTNGLYRSMKRGAFRVHRIEGHGKKAARTPGLYTKKALDPASCRFSEHADEIWETTNRWVSDHVPDELWQSVERVPVYQCVQNGYHSDGRFMGWRWVCPGCAREVRILYYPLEPLCRVKLLKRVRSEIDELPRPNATFACQACHEVRYFSRTRRGWAHLVTYMSGGLLYGHEVKRPEWFALEQKRPFHPQINRRPSKRRAEVTERLLKGMNYHQIARELRISWSSVHCYVLQIYRMHRVHSVFELAEQLGVKLPMDRWPNQTDLAMREKVCRRWLNGDMQKTIARELGLSVGQVLHHLQKLYRKHGVHSREELERQVGMIHRGDAEDAEKDKQKTRT